MSRPLTPLIKPPYGRITAYNLNTGDLVWQVANGETYDWIKNHPALKGLTLPKLGRADEGGIVVTKTLVFAGMREYIAVSVGSRTTPAEIAALALPE